MGEQSTVVPEWQSGEYRVLITADLHLGVVLNNRSLLNEQQEFLGWLAGMCRAVRADMLAVAGDVFDTNAVAAGTQGVYYGFLARLKAEGCRSICVIAGNHDSPSFIEAPKELLALHGIHVFDRADGEHPEEALVELYSDAGKLCGVLGAIPYLRDTHLSSPARMEEAGDGVEAQHRKRYHCYRSVARAAAVKAAGRPVMLLGHEAVQTSGKVMADGGGYVGNALTLSSEEFPSSPDLIVLGHLHRPHAVDAAGKIRYCGSPYPVSFDDLTVPKRLLLVRFLPDAPLEVIEIPVEAPHFMPLVRLEGTADEVREKFRLLQESGQRALVDAVYSAAVPDPALQDELRAYCGSGRGAKLELLQCRLKRPPALTAELSPAGDAALAKAQWQEQLRKPEALFERYMTECGLKNEYEQLRPCFLEAAEIARETLAAEQSGRESRQADAQAKAKSPQEKHKEDGGEA